MSPFGVELPIAIEWPIIPAPQVPAVVIGAPAAVVETLV